ncbi:hypothetical protein L2E82_16959 [Cichorium intybus]|uniref:Uncharacterized protein n=2 Tax=Cichorium intybus TaxID=13427 RepID=A0ACB9F7E3_CICIN|nr:hypothetical protein L2E82_32079 [Cichorium intybus]KAI3766881.1 hypothetical protein L2E82_16959 [Cichorium intybus]
MTIVVKWFNSVLAISSVLSTYSYSQARSLKEDLAFDDYNPNPHDLWVQIRIIRSADRLGKGRGARFFNFIEESLHAEKQRGDTDLRIDTYKRSLMEITMLVNVSSFVNGDAGE